MRAEDAAKIVLDSFDISDALKLIEQESKKGKLECHFTKGNCLTKITTLDYKNGLKALGYHCRSYGPYLMKISWDPHYIED